MNVLIGCEFSGTVRDAFINSGHNAWSCDILPTESPGPHIQDDIRIVINSHTQWDLLIAFPPCTHLTKASAWCRSNAGRDESLQLVKDLYFCQIPRVCIENPPGWISTAWMPPSQYIQPWWFGHGEIKETGLWLKWLPELYSTDIVSGRDNRLARIGQCKNRWKIRSKTYPGVAKAMAYQWGGYDQERIQKKELSSSLPVSRKESMRKRNLYR